jgi:hypothetical protein
MQGLARAAALTRVLATFVEELKASTAAKTLEPIAPTVPAGAKRALMFCNIIRQGHRPG